jgi:cAMP-binding proteins - catabolite gene activator and regulatory subunit of cAMP-dependent protein kinases
MIDLELLNNFDFIKNLNDDERHLLLQNLTKITYTKGERIVKNGEFVTHAVFIIKGFVKIHSEFKNKTVIMDICGPGSFTALSSMIGMEKHSFDITCIEDSIIYLINIEVMRKMIEQNGLFARHLVDYMNEKLLHYFDYNLTMLIQSNIHGRLANILIYLAQKVFQNHSFDLLLTRKELSQLTNVSRENVIKVLYQFDSEGLIKLNGQRIQILNPEQLKQLAKNC